MKAFIPENRLKPAAGQVPHQRDGFPSSGRPGISAGLRFLSAGLQKLQRDFDFFRRESKPGSGTVKKTAGRAGSILCVKKMSEDIFADYQ